MWPYHVWIHCASIHLCIMVSGQCVCVCVCVCVRNTICIVGGFIIGFIFTVLLFICVCIWSEGNVCVCCVCVRVHSLCFFHLRTCMQRILQFLCVTGFIIVFHCVSIHYAVWSGFSREQCASSHPLFHSVCHRLHLLGISHEVRHTHTHTQLSSVCVSLLLLSVWFSSARLGMVVSFVAWFFIYIPFFYFPQNYHRYNL